MFVAPPFSLLLPVYDGDRADRLQRAFQSAVVDQTLRPDEVVVVQDGPLNEELAACVQDLCARSPVPVVLIAVPDCRGLGPALDVGLRACRYDVVARMDADDVAMSHRFATQLPLIVDADIVGGGLLEFEEDIDQIVGRRVPPVGQDRIARYARLHDPFNHPTVVYRRQAVLAAGGYGDLPQMEDYWLFARMLASGTRAVNIAEPLVYYRVGVEAYKRRGGVALLRSEMQLQRYFHDEGFTTSFQHMRNVGIRGGYRLLPWWIRRAAYRAVIVGHGKRASTLADLAPMAPDVGVGVCDPCRKDVVAVVSDARVYARVRR